MKCSTKCFSFILKKVIKMMSKKTLPGYGLESSGKRSLLYTRRKFEPPVDMLKKSLSDFPKFLAPKRIIIFYQMGWMFRCRPCIFVFRLKVFCHFSGHTEGRDSLLISSCLFLRESQVIREQVVLNMAYMLSCAFKPVDLIHLHRMRE